eukprot:3643587-Prymnesium_polylepis.2
MDHFLACLARSEAATQHPRRIRAGPRRSARVRAGPRGAAGSRGAAGVRGGPWGSAGVRRVPPGSAGVRRRLTVRTSVSSHTRTKANGLGVLGDGAAFQYPRFHATPR